MVESSRTASVWFNGLYRHSNLREYFKSFSPSRERVNILQRGSPKGGSHPPCALPFSLALSQVSPQERFQFIYIFIVIAAKAPAHCSSTKAFSLRKLLHTERATKSHLLSRRSARRCARDCFAGRESERGLSCTLCQELTIKKKKKRHKFLLFYTKVQKLLTQFN